MQLEVKPNHGHISWENPIQFFSLRLYLFNFHSPKNASIFKEDEHGLLKIRRYVRVTKENELYRSIPGMAPKGDQSARAAAPWGAVDWGRRGCCSGRTWQSPCPSASCMEPQPAATQEAQNQSITAWNQINSFPIYMALSIEAAVAEYKSRGERNWGMSSRSRYRQRPESKQKILVQFELQYACNNKEEKIFEALACEAPNIYT